MAQCPVCAAALTDDFGLIECPSCGVQLILHMDGRVESQAAVSSEFTGSAQNESAMEGAVPAEFDFGADELQSFEVENQPEPTPESIEELAEPDGNPIPVEQLMAEDPLFNEEPFVDDLFAEQPQAAREMSEEKPVQLAMPAAPELSDIARFANSESVSTRDGSLRYNLWVVGIDTADVREAFREALTDRKFMWDTDQILKSIRDGQVQIENVTASKAHILISRLRSMPVQVRWEQYVVQQG